jgi:crotonobetainyl-CoA:carnitine CoA-transferase CaiB-like acyl-CoA transferase
MAAAISILAALFKREATGTGDFCDVSMSDGALSWLTIHASNFVATKENPQRERMHLSGLYPCYRVYPAADGWLTVGALEPQFWAALCEAIEREDLAGDAFAMGDRRDEVIAELGELFSKKTRAEWMEHFGDRDVCVGPVYDLTETFADEHNRARGMVFDAEVPGAGPWSHVGNPLKLASNELSAMRLPPPKMGEHTEDVLAEAGLTAEQMQELRAGGVI